MGIFRPRDDVAGETEATIDLISYSYYYSDIDNTYPITSQDVVISPDGTFTGSLKIDNFNPGSYEVRLRIGDKAVLSHYLQVADYTKPSYTIDVTRTKSMCMHGTLWISIYRPTFSKAPPPQG
jgi:uncharacterized protein YfaS (alpha-2-macroglobulin family)